MTYLYLKSLHIIFVVTWFSGLFYIVRLFIYHTEAFDSEKGKKEVLIPQFSLMEKRLWYGITWPSAILTLAFGLALAFHYPAWPRWLQIKLGIVMLLFAYHLYCERIYQGLKIGPFLSSTKLRFFNEFATLFLFSIVYLVVLKDAFNAFVGLVWGIALSLLLFLGIVIYRKTRMRR